METMLHEKLHQDEKLLWSAKPEEFETLDAAYKTAIIRKIVTVLLCTVILGGWYAVSAIANGVKVQPIAILVCASPFLYSIWNDFSDAKKLKNQVVYGLSNQRLMILNGKQLSSVEYGKVPCYDLVTDAAGHVTLVCGVDAMKAKEKNRREATVCGARMNMDTDLCESFAMYGITAEADKVKRILAQYLAN